MIYVTLFVMTIEEMVQKAHIDTPIDLTAIETLDKTEPLVHLESSHNVQIEPYWRIKGNWEGERYLQYIAYNPNYTEIYVRATLAKMLSSAASYLPTGYKLVIRAGHRPIEVQLEMLKDCALEYQSRHDVSGSDALDYARQYVTDPRLRLPPHTCGAAVDATIIDERGELLDFGSEINETSKASNLFYDGLSPQQQKNRSLLLEAMLQAGFASLSTEWWHYSYGDQVWAWFYGEDKSLYGISSLTDSMFI